MSDKLGPIQEAVAQHLMMRLHGFAQGLGLDGATARNIVEKVLADMPTRTNDERLMEARKRMLMASA